MGFGLLFFGYFIAYAFSISQSYFFADIVGALVLLFAFAKLTEYNTYYRRASVACLAFLVLCGATAVNLMFHLYPTDGKLTLGISILKLVTSCVLHVYVFLGARGISLGAEASKLAKNAERNLTMAVVYYVFALIALLIEPLLPEETAKAVSFLVLAYFAVCVFFNLIFFYRCFKTLYPDDESFYAPKRSRFKAINWLYDKFDSFDKKSDEYRRESIQFAIDQSKKLQEERDNKYQHKKRKKKKK